MARNWLFLSIALLIAEPMAIAGEAPVAPAGEEAESLGPEAGVVYRGRYRLGDAGAKLVDNQGNGREDLYGVRNFRAVLNGVYYRGGANNVYNKHGKRANSNPLTAAGLENLCREGFTAAVYLYPTNFSSAPGSVRCRDFNGNENVLAYSQISPLSYRRQDQRKLLTLVYEHVRNARRGPVYAHCWNGWHASGFVAAITLRQFCGFTSEQAISYWNKNTDGNNGRSYDKVRGQIRAFEPFADLAIDEAERAALCPRPEGLGFLR